MGLVTKDNWAGVCQTGVKSRETWILRAETTGSMSVGLRNEDWLMMEIWMGDIFYYKLFLCPEKNRG